MKLYNVQLICVPVENILKRFVYKNAYSLYIFVKPALQLYESAKVNRSLKAGGKNKSRIIGAVFVYIKNVVHSSHTADFNLCHIKRPL